MDTILHFFAVTLPGHILFGYILGSVPFGLILCSLFGYGDIRKIGSKNIGATNVLRTGNKLLALLTVILDASKGAAAFILMYMLLNALPSDLHIQCLSEIDCPPDDLLQKQYAMNATVAAFSAVLGHMFPVWLKFKGGKGVATAFGAMLAATPITAAVAALTWLLSAVMTRLSSLAALSAALLAPAVSYIFYGEEVAALNALISLLVWIRHKDNIKRLMKGEESKIGEKKKESDGSSKAT